MFVSQLDQKPKNINTSIITELFRLRITKLRLQLSRVRDLVGFWSLRRRFLARFWRAHEELEEDKSMEVFFSFSDREEHVFLIRILFFIKWI